MVLVKKPMWCCRTLDEPKRLVPLGASRLSRRGRPTFRVDMTGLVVEAELPSAIEFERGRPERAI